MLARKQEFAYNPILQNYFATDTLLSTSNMILGDFTKDKKVKSISGPLDTEGNVATQIKLGEQYIFRATPNQPVAEFYLLAIKWAYRLDDGELTFFKNQTEIANSTQGQIAVTFPKSFKANKIKVYGFYTSASERVCVEVGTDYLGESVVQEVVQPDKEADQVVVNNAPQNENLVTIEQLKTIFTKAKVDDLKIAAETYNKFMIELEMETIWDKAHFFAQTYVESGLGLKVKTGEGFNYYYEDLKIFPPFKTTEGKQKAQLWGPPDKKTCITRS